MVAADLAPLAQHRFVVEREFDPVYLLLERHRLIRFAARRRDRRYQAARASFSSGVSFEGCQQ